MLRPQGDETGGAARLEGGAATPAGGPWEATGVPAGAEECGSRAGGGQKLIIIQSAPLSLFIEICPYFIPASFLLLASSKYFNILFKN